MDLVGLPDWHRPLSFGGRPAFAAYDQPGRFFAAPLRWEPSAVEGEPPFLVDVYAQDREADGPVEFGLVTCRYHAAFDLDSLAVDALADLGVASGSAVTFAALPTESGLVALTAPASLELPTPLLEPYPLETAALVSPAVVVRLDGLAADVVVAALRRGLALLGATAWVSAIGVAVRADAEAHLDGPRWTAAVRACSEQTPAAGSPPAAGPLRLPVAAVRELVAEDPEAAGIRLKIPTGLEAGDGTDDITAAVVDRLLGRTGRLIAAPDRSATCWVELQPLDGQLQLDLREAVAAPRFWALAADPLGPLRAAPTDQVEATVVRRHAAPSLGTGWHTLTFSPTLVQPLVGVHDQAVEVTVPPAPPHRPQRIERVVSLPPGAGAASTTLRLGLREPLRYQWAVTTVLESRTGVRVVPGPSHEASSAWTAVAPQESGLRYLPLEASPALLAESAVTVTARSRAGQEIWELTAELDRSRPAALLVLPEDAGDPELSAVASTADGRRCASDPVTATRLRLDPFSFPGVGVRSVELALEAGSPDILVELTGEDDRADPARTSRLALTSSTPTATYSWYARSPFRAGMCWRIAGTTTWSPPTADAIRVSATTTFETS